MNQRIQTVLFDLDGTLLDTAPDLANALNAVLKRNKQSPLPYEQIRPVVSHGGRALIELGFKLGPEHPDFASLKQELLDYYRAHIAEQTTLFPGMDDVLDGLEQLGINWGVVTNKPARLTDPLMDALDLRRRAVTVVSGDTLKECKPHPAPLLYACGLAGSEPEACLYVGDAERDIEAGHSAGMSTLVATFGYLTENDEPETWGATALIQHPTEVFDWLE
jgi:2-phosphoglycolate phosphatase